MLIDKGEELASHEIGWGINESLNEDNDCLVKLLVKPFFSASRSKSSLPTLTIRLGTL